MVTVVVSLIPTHPNVNRGFQSVPALKAVSRNGCGSRAGCRCGGGSARMGEYGGNLLDGTGKIRMTPRNDGLVGGLEDFSYFFH